MIIEIIIATIFVSLVSLSGIILLSLKKETMETMTFIILSFATGALFAAAFFDLLPEAIEKIDASSALTYSLAGIMAFFILERLIHWHHEHHDHTAHEKPIATLVLLGDSFHNFFDGIAIAASFLGGIELGIATTIAIIMHEIPQEISDFTLLKYAGYSTKKALLANVFTGLAALAGALVFFFLADAIEGLEVYGLAFTAGAFIYIAGTDLLPELHKEEKRSKSMVQLVAMISGIALFWLLINTLGG